MRLLKTTEAKVLPAVTKTVNRSAELCLKNAFALLTRTPLSLLGKINKRFVSIFFVLSEIFWIKQLFKYLVRNNILAFLIGAFGQQAFGSLLYFRLEIARKAFCTQLVAAIGHCYHIMRFVLAIAGITHKNFLLREIFLSRSQIEIENARD